jgi:hypothetical protein
MPRIKLTLKTKYGEIEVSGNNTKELLDSLDLIDEEIIKEINDKVSKLVSPQIQNKLNGILRIDKDGPVIVTKKDFTHYEAIGLILYAYDKNISTSKKIRERLTASGKKVTVPARINEMRKRGYVFKPDKRQSKYKLSSKGLKWIENEVIPSLMSKN